MGYTSAEGAPYDFKASRNVDFNKVITAQDKDDDGNLTDKVFTSYSGVGYVRESPNGRILAVMTVTLTEGQIAISIADTLLTFKAGRYFYDIIITTDTGKKDRYLKGAFILYN